MAGKVVRFPPKIIFNLADNAKLEDAVHVEDFESYLAPNGICVNRYDLSSEEATAKFFKVLMKSHRNYKKKYIIPFNPHETKAIISPW